MKIPVKEMTWQEAAAAMQKYRDDTIASVVPAIPDVPSELPLNVSTLPGQLLSQDDIAITESSPEDLLSALASGDLSSETVTTSFLRRAGLASKLVNCVTELLPFSALQRAQYLDSYLAEHKKPIGPLHGLPISVKEHVGMKDLNLNAGFVAWCDRVGPDDALILKLLRNAGAVFYVRTTQPQLLMHLETSSNIYGVTVNPFNRSLTSGGSSGGEGALLGMRGSCLGIGTDIGGSIRSPAANNGLFGLRPTSLRLPLAGNSVTMLGAEHILGVIGPLSTSLDGVKLFMKSLLDQKPWLLDPTLVPIPWTPSSPPTRIKPLKIGILLDDGVVRPHPPILSALTRLRSLLSTSSAVELLDYIPHKHDEAWDIISSLYFTDGGAEDEEVLAASGEPWRPLSEFIIKDNKNCKPRSQADAWALHCRRDAYRTEYLAHWNGVFGDATTDAKEDEEDESIDVLLCPVGPGAAPPLDCARYWGYTSQWNLLDYPALVFPTGLSVGEGPDAGYGDYDEDWTARNADDEYNYKLWTEGVGPEKYKDAPISLQLVGRRYQDERVIEALETITRIAGLPFKA